MSAGNCPQTLFCADGGWFSAWRAAYLRGVRADAFGLPMLRDTGRIGPFGYNRLRSQTNIHSARITGGAGALTARDVDLVEIDHLAEGSPLIAAARGIPGATVEPHARVPVTLCDDFDRWFGARSKRERQRLRRLDREAALDFAIDRDTSDLAAVIALEAAGWKGAAGTAIRDDPADLSFYTAIAQAAADAGVLRIATLRDGGRLAAFEFGVLDGDRLFVLKAGYDEAYAERSIGHVLAMRHIRACCAAADIALYDVMGNGMTPAPHKLRFADRTETLYRIRLFGRTPRGQMLRAWFAARSVAKRLRDRMRA